MKETKSRRAFAKFYPHVTTVKDGPKTIRVIVSKDDVTSSKLKEHTGCAIAEACKRQLPIDSVVVSRSVAYLIKGIKATRYILPKSAQREIMAFDRGGRFMPGTYTLQAPDDYQKLGVKHRRLPSTNDGSRGEQAPARRAQVKGIRFSLSGLGKH